MDQTSFLDISFPDFDYDTMMAVLNEPPLVQTKDISCNTSPLSGDLQTFACSSTSTSHPVIDPQTVACSSTSTSQPVIDHEQSPIPKAEPFLNRKKTTCIMFQGYTYNNKYDIKDEQSVWRCSQRKCSGRIKTSTNYSVVTNSLVPHQDDCTPLLNTEANLRIKRSRVVTDTSDVTTKHLAKENGVPYDRNLLRQRRRKRQKCVSDGNPTDL